MRFAHTTETTEAQGLYEESRPVSVISFVASSIELGPMPQGIVDLSTEATDCHSCFVYLLADGVLTMRAAPRVYANAVGVVQTHLDEGSPGWVARHRTPELIRENSMADPRMKFLPVLEEERFQSVVAVPIISRAGEMIGVIVLHTEAPTSQRVASVSRTTSLPRWCDCGLQPLRQGCVDVEREGATGAITNPCVTSGDGSDDIRSAQVQTSSSTDQEFR